MQRFLSWSTKNATFSVAARGCSFINAAATTAIPALSSRRFYCSSQPSDGAGGKQRGSDNKSNQTLEGTATLQPTSASKMPLSDDFFASPGSTACMVCDEYVEDVNEIYQDGEDGNPKFHFTPVDQKNLFAVEQKNPFDWDTYKLQRSENDKNATLIVNVAKMLGKGETKLQDNFLCHAQFKAVHFVGTESLEEIGHRCLYEAEYLTRFTMSTPCPNLKRVGDCWLSFCSALSKVDFTGCTALESVGDYWLNACSSLPVVTFKGCSALESVGGHWLTLCTELQAPDFSALVTLKSVGCEWLSQCSSLKTPNFSGCSALEEVDVSWMAGCESLEVIDLAACNSLKIIYEEWLINCTSLHRVVLPSDTELPDDIVRRVKKYLK